MFKKWKERKAKAEQKKKEIEQLKKLQQYYGILRTGATFVQFVRDDLKRQGQDLNRHDRRRFEKSLVKGEFTEELVAHYKNKIEKILAEITKRLNPPEEVDGAKFYEEAKRSCDENK